MQIDRRGYYCGTRLIFFNFISLRLTLFGLLILIGSALPASAQMSDLEATRDALGRSPRVRLDDIERVGGGGTESVWQMTGPFGGDVMSLAVDPRNSDRILIGAQDGQLFRSTDGGATWRRLRPGLGTTGIALTIILFDRARPGVIYVGAQQIKDAEHDSVGGGVFVSEDDGVNWREITSLRGRSVRGMVQSAKDPAVFAVAARDGIYRSTDRGANWRKITPENDAELTNFHSVALDPRDVDTFYVGTTHLPWKTTDGGATWKRAGSKETGMIDDSDIFAIHIDEQNPDVVLMSACSGIYRSTNSGKQWAKIQGIPSTSRRTHVIYQHPTRGNLLFAGTTEGLWRSTDNGKPESWSRVTPLRLVINSVAVNPDRPDRIFLGTNDYGVLISNDGGESYEPSNIGFISRQVQTVLADRTERGRVYAGVIFDGANGGLFVSEDSGVTWQQSMRGMGLRDVYSVHQPFAHPDRLYAGTNHGIFRSDDHGRSWAVVKKDEPEPVKAEEPITPPATAPPGRSRQVVVSPQLRPVVQKRTKAPAKRPTPRGKPRVKNVAPPKPVEPPKPEDLLVNLENQVFNLMSFVPVGGSEATTLLASTWDGLFMTEDEKKGWKPLKIVDASGTVLTSGSIEVMTSNPLVPGSIWIATEDGLFVSRDNGATFAPLRLDGERHQVKAIAFDPRDAAMIYVGSLKGFFRSTDGGRNWEKRGGGMPLAVSISAITISPVDPDEVFLSDTNFGGFYHSRDRGRTWEAFDTSALPTRRFRSLGADPFDRNRIYAGPLSTGGVYVMTRQGEGKSK